MILVTQNAISELTTVSGDLANTLAQRRVAEKEAQYAGEIRRLLDAGLAVMQRAGDGRARVVDIVAEAGLSNDAFYRYFPSKDALVQAIITDGAQRLRSYLEHQMSKATKPEAQVRRWIEGVLAQASDAEVADATRAVLRNAGGPAEGLAAGHSAMNAPLGALLRSPIAALGSTTPDLDAALVAFAVIGTMSDYLRRGVRPKRSEIDGIVGFCLAAITKVAR